jgi:hypothetical protein
MPEAMRAPARIRIYIPILVDRKARERLEGDDDRCRPGLSVAL